MPPFTPYTYQIGNDGLYSPAVQEAQAGMGDTRPRWTSGPQTVVHPMQQTLWSATKLGLGVGALAMLGTRQITPTKRGFDYMLHGIRAIEEYSPGRVFRTFQVSHMLSVLESPSLQKRYFSPEILSAMRAGGVDSAGYKWLEHLSRVTGRDMTTGDIISRGFRYEGGQLLAGETGRDVLLRHAGVVRAPSGTGTRFQEGYARSLARGPLFDPRTGTDPILRESRKAAQVFGQRVSFLDAAGKRRAEPFMFAGGRTRFQSAGRFLAGYGTSLAERINQLARAPFELPVISDIMKRLPVINRLRLGVVPSSGLKTIGKITAKLGLLGTAGMLSYRQLDYAARESELLDNTILAEGIGPAVGNIWTRSQMAISGMADWFDLHTYRERQEEIAPGSTSLQKLLAFPILGAFGGLLGGYASRLGKQFRYRRLGLDITQASLATGAEDAFFRQSVYGRSVPEIISGGLDKKTIELIQQSTDKKVGGLTGRFIQRIAKTQRRRTAAGALLRGFGQLTPGRLGWVGGALLGAAAVAPLLPGALVPSERPEELEKIYSGEKKVAVRKGRWWEFGRTPYEGTRIDRFREHWYPRMLHRAKEKAIWGEKPPGPFERWWIENFTYELEQKHYQDRPYPMTGTAFEDVPFIGPLLASTIGQMVKPAAIMHPEAWIKATGADGGGQRFLAPHLKYGQTVLPGEAEAGEPISPYGLKGTLGEQVYRMTEMVGLPGFTMTQIKEAITGSQDVFDEEMQIETARRMYGAERELWDLELGGGLGTTELLRRLYPHRRRQIEQYNPIRNTMPEWLPGPGERSPDFLHGDPFCLTGDVLVETSAGPKEMNKLKPGMWIVTHTGRQTPIKKTVKRDMQPGEHLFEIKVSSLASLPIKASEEHPFWTTDGWKTAQDLSVGDYVGYPIHDGLASCVPKGYSDLIELDPWMQEGFAIADGWLYIQGSQEYADCVAFIEKNPGPYQRGELKAILETHDWNRKTFENAQRGIRLQTLNRIPAYLDRGTPEWGIVAGYYLAEGSSTKDSLVFSFHQKEKEYHQELLQSFNKLWGVEGHIYNASKGNGCDVVFCNKALAQLVPKMLGTTFDKKTINSSPRSVGHLLRCLFNGDGSFFFDNGKPRLALKAKNIKLLIQVREILLRDYRCVGYLVEDQLIVRGQAAKDLAMQLGCKYKECADSSRTVRHTYIKDDYVWMRIFSKQEVPQEPVYGLEVDVDDSFCVVGVATHNTKVPEGEMRLPGAGYAALHPELKGIAPDDYPAFHRFAILADVAPYTDKYKESLIGVRRAIKEKQLSQEQIAEYKETLKQVSARKVRREFTPYRYRDRKMTEWETALAVKNEAVVEGSEEPSWFESTIGKYWEELAHGAETPFELLTPISPAAKLVHMRTAVEDYERTQVFGTENAFWGHPVRDFFGPFFDSAKNAMGFEGIPEHIQEKRDLEEYFDMLKYVKYTRLKRAAQAASDEDTVQEYENKRRETLFGINPYTYNFSHIFRSLPRRDRDYFNAFVDADLDERARILEIVPENEQALLMARWELEDANDIKKAIKEGVLSEEQVERGRQQIREMYEKKEVEGMPKNQKLWTEYLSTRLEGESYPDWYRRVKLLEEELAGKPLPGEDWVGWHPAVDLSDIKLKIVENQAKNMYDYDLWPDRARAVARRPFVAEAAAEIEGTPDYETLRARLTDVLSAHDIESSHITLIASQPGDSVVNLDLEHDRSMEMHDIMRRNT